MVFDLYLFIYNVCIPSASCHKMALGLTERYAVWLPVYVTGVVVVK